MEKVKLGKDVWAYMRPAIGDDERLSLGMRSKMEPFLKDRNDDSFEYTFQRDFAIAMICTERVEGMDFTVPSVSDDGETIAAAYRAFVKLRLDVCNNWRYAPHTVEETTNSVELLPPELLPEATRNNPLSSSGGKRSAAR